MIFLRKFETCLSCLFLIDLRKETFVSVGIKGDYDHSTLASKESYGLKIWKVNLLLPLKKNIEFYQSKATFFDLILDKQYKQSSIFYALMQASFSLLLRIKNMEKAICCTNVYEKCGVEIVMPNREVNNCRVGNRNAVNYLLHMVKRAKL